MVPTNVPAVQKIPVLGCGTDWPSYRTGFGAKSIRDSPTTLIRKVRLTTVNVPDAFTVPTLPFRVATATTLPLPVSVT